MITDTEIENAFGNSDFGKTPKRDVLKHTLLKYASGYSTGHTAKCIAIELELYKEEKGLTKKGKEYLFAAFSEGYSY